MKVLVTGAHGFVGRNLCESLKAIRDGKDRRPRWHALLPLEVCEFDLGSTYEELVTACADCNFVVHLAGVNRPADGDFSGNQSALCEVLGALENSGNRCTVLLTSSAQATLEGRFEGSEYGRSKLEAERMLREYGERAGAKVLVYRLPNLYGKWCRPNYNSAVATFCDAIANGRPYTVNDPSVELELLYIDDLVNEILCAMLGEETVGDDGYCHAGTTDRATLGQIVGMLKGFQEARETLTVPELSDGSFSKKLYSTYLSYLDVGSSSYPLQSNVDERGSFTEFLRTSDKGQVSINVSKPGVTKGNHWHHTKWEKFLVVSGEALIRERHIGTDANGSRYPVDEYRVSGDRPTVVEMLPGYTHSITNLSHDKDLVTVMWANESFDPEHPDTFFEEV